MGMGSDAKSYVISADWDPTDPSFEVLNTETAKGLSHFYVCCTIFSAVSMNWEVVLCPPLCNIASEKHAIIDQ